MKKTIIKILLLLVVLFSVTSCEVIGGIFKAGMGLGIFLVIIVIGIIVLIIRKLGSNK